ncbi:hypothetical protein LTS10_007086 [Elasticomyces elasticus]|nr:hypothetical protein LTS10_007086 [Elasticomyces elasticus]
MAGGVWFLQESPRWLTEHDRHDEAKIVLQKLHSTGQNDDFLQLEFEEIRDTIVAEKEVATVSWKQLLAKPSWRKRLFLGCGIQAFGQLSGINVINYYGNEIYKLLGIDTATSLKIVGISGALSIVYRVIGLWLLDRVGRIKPMIVATAGCALALLVNSVLSQYYVAGNEETTNPNGNALRAMVAMNFVTALASVGFRYFYAFFVFNLCAVVCYIFLYPETAGRTLEQMDELFGDQLVPHSLENPEKAKAVMMEWFGDGSETRQVVS